MSAMRKVQYPGSNASRLQAKICKFLKDAKSELEHPDYATLLEALAKYGSGIFASLILRFSL